MQRLENSALLLCSQMVWKTGVQSQVESYQRLKKWYLMLPCLTLSIIRYRSRVKWSNLWNGVAPSPHLSVVAIEKGAFGSISTKVANFTYSSAKLASRTLPYNSEYISFTYLKIKHFHSGHRKKEKNSLSLMRK